MQDYEAEIYAIYVDISYMNFGIGTKLIEAALNDLLKKYKKVILWCSKDNTNSINFYQKRNFKKSIEINVQVGNKVIKEIAFLYDNMKICDLKTPQDVYSFIDSNIQYGWVDIYGKEHLNTMKKFRKIYRTMSINETLEHKIGTCIEQVNLMHYLLNNIKIKNKMFCCRIFEPDDYNNLEEDEHMHCFVLYYENEKVYHIEHPNFEKKGIYEYSSEEEAIKTIENYYKNLRGGKSSPTKEFFEVPVGISFKEFNTYINHV